MIVYISIALTVYLQGKPPMTGKESQHMIQKTASGLDDRRLVSVQTKAQTNVCFCCFTGNFTFSHAVSSFLIMLRRSGSTHPSRHPALWNKPANNRTKLLHLFRSADGDTQKLRNALPIKPPD